MKITFTYRDSTGEECVLTGRLLQECDLEHASTVLGAGILWRNGIGLRTKQSRFNPDKRIVDIRPKQGKALPPEEVTPLAWEY